MVFWRTVHTDLDFWRVKASRKVRIGWWWISQPKTPSLPELLSRFSLYVCMYVCGVEVLICSFSLVQFSSGSWQHWLILIPTSYLSRSAAFLLSHLFWSELSWDEMRTKKESGTLSTEFILNKEWPNEGVNDKRDGVLSPQLNTTCVSL
jgi:hypothetical protein